MRRKLEVETKVPGFKELENKVIDLSMEYGKAKIKCKNNPELASDMTKISRRNDGT